MIVRSPPFQMGQQLWGLLGSGPGAACQRRHAMSHRQIHPLDKSRVQPSREAQSLQGDLESLPVSRGASRGVTRTSLRRR